MDEIQLRPYHCGISVSDLDSAVEWFDRVLGFKLDRKEDLSALGFQIAFVRNGDFSVELFQHEHSQPASPERAIPDEDVRTQGNKHICFLVPDLDAMVLHFEANDVPVVMGPLEVANLYVAFIHGPDDVLIEFAEQR